MKVFPLVLFSLAMAVSSASEPDIVLEPVRAKVTDTDTKISLQVKDTGSWTGSDKATCLESSEPSGYNGVISVDVEENANLSVSLVIPSNTQLFTYSEEKKDPPTSARVQIEFERCPPDGFDKFTLTGNEGDEYDSFFVVSERIVGDATTDKNASLTVVDNSQTIIQVSDCKISISLNMSFTGCQNWHGDEPRKEEGVQDGTVFQIAVPTYDKKNNVPYDIGDEYEFKPCNSFIDFDYYKPTTTRVRAMRFLEEPESAIQSAENCPFNQTLFEQGRCQRCLVSASKPTAAPTTAPTSSGLDAGSYVVLSIMGVGFILTVGIIIQSYKKSN